MAADFRIVTDCIAHADAIATVTRAAFAKEYGSGDGEVALIAALRADGDVAVELAAFLDGEIVGHVLFSKLRVEPATIRVAALQDWSLHPDPGIRYYSGKAVYRKQFSFSDAVSSGPLFLELGVVKNICRVWLNGADLGIVWTAPWRLEVTGKLKHGVNDIRIEVINLWPNRLIGDAALPPEQRRTNTNITFKKEDPLLPSGLLGPVCLMTVGP